MPKKPTITGIPVCGTCYHYRNTTVKDEGLCRRYPPVVVFVDEDGTVVSEAPIVGKEHDACGEYAQGPRVVN